MFFGRTGRSALRRFVMVLCTLLPVSAALPSMAGAVSGTLVLSQVYGGGGNSGALYTHDFIEIFNLGTSPVDVTGWTVQYAAAGSASWTTTSLAGVIPAGGYYLVREAQGAGGTLGLPTPDATGTTAMSATAGKVALVSAASALSGACPSNPAIVDLIGYGSANCFEGTACATLSNTTAALRANAGCTETDDNSADFAPSAPTPRNSAAPAHPCQFTLDVTVTPLAGGDVLVSPDLPAYPAGSDVELTAVPAAHWQFVAWSGDASGNTNPLTVTMDADKSITATFALETHTLTVSVVGSGSVTKAPDQAAYEHGSTVDLTAVPDPGWHFVAWSGDASGNTNPLTVTMDADKSITATFEVDAEVGALVISQIYGGGGNSGALYTHDFIELFNPGGAAVSLTGLSVQYASASGSTWSVTPLVGTIGPGGYYLVQEAQGAGGTVALPTPDASGSIAMSATAGKVALVASPIALADACPADPAIVDLAGYGAANCSEGAAAAALDNTTAALRKGGGCTDTDDNAADFATGAPAPRNTASPSHSCEHGLVVTVDPPGGGTVAVVPDLDTYPHGSLVTLTATPILGWHFAGWSGDAGGGINPLAFTMNDDAAIVVHFAPNVPTGTVVISQVYGGGGNSGADYKHDYIELYNRGNITVNLNGWSVQYASQGGDQWFTTNLVGSIAAGAYYLVQELQGAGGTLDLPAPDAVGTIAVDAASGKAALVDNMAVLSGSCPSGGGIVDLVGYGAADCSEGGAAAAPDNPTAALRNGNGCDDTDDNAADFTVGGPVPRNSATPHFYCPIWLGAEDAPTLELALAPVVPNPTQGPARIAFDLPREASVTLRVFDLQGRVVARLVQGSLPAGRHVVTWDGAREDGRARAGLYFVRLEVPGRILKRSMIVLN